MRKAITVMLIMILIFEFMPSNHVMASSLSEFNKLQEGQSTTTTREHKNSSSIKKNNETYKSNDGSFNIIYTILSFVIVGIPLSIQALLTLAVLPENVTKVQVFTIEDLLLGRFDLFNANYMDLNNLSRFGDEGQVPSNSNKLIKANIAKWFYAVRTFSIVALFGVLIAIGLLMAISTISSDKAKYKEMLIHWFASFAILMFLPYIMSLSMNICDVAVGVIDGASKNMMQTTINNADIEQSDGLNLEKALLYGTTDSNGKEYEGIITKIQKSESAELLALVIVYCVIAFYQVKFFFLYIKRMLSIGFLVVISPLITITYSIDKARDNQAQAFKTWLKEFLVNLFIQPLHALLFVIFMYSVYGIVERAPILAVIFMAALSRGEQLVRTIFKIERTSALGFLGKGRRKK